MNWFGDVKRRMLGNGLEVLVREDRSAPVVALNFFVRVGSLNEDEGIAGWSHGVEHMLFKGTERRGPGDIAREIQNAGGQINAGTGYESTNYYIILPSGNFSQALDIHADVLRHSTFDEYELEKERQVLIKENEMYRDRPRGFGFTWEKLMETAFTRHRYRRGIGGPDENLHRVGRDAIVAHKQKYYVPSNITYVVVGDVSADDVFEEMEAKFGDWTAPLVKPDVSPVEPLQTEFRFLEIEGDVERSYVKIGFHIPTELHPDSDALLVLAHILASGRTSRLYRRVREEQNLIYDSSVMQVAGQDPGYLAFEFSCDADKTEAAVTSVFEEITRFHREPISAEELDRTLHSVRGDTVGTAETMEGQASMLGHYALLGDYRLAGEYLERMSRVDAAGVREAARHYLNLDQATVMIHSPAGKRPHAPTSAEMCRRLREVEVGDTNGDSTVADSTTRVRRIPTATGRSRESVEVVTLSRGTRVVLQADGRLPKVALAAYLPVGSGAERTHEAGLAQMTQLSMMKGAGGRSAQELADALEGLGARMSPFADRDACGFSLSVLREDLAEGLDLFGGVLTAPEFPEEMVTREKERRLAELASLRDNTIQYTFTHYFGMLFRDHAYGRPVLGTETALREMKREDLVGWHRRAYDPAKLVVSAVGDFDRDAMLAWLETTAGQLPGNGGMDEPDPPVVSGTGIRETLHKDVSQAVVILGCPGPNHHNPDRYALDVWETVLSGMGNRLFTNLRDEKHLCYFTGAFAYSLAQAGTLGAYVGTGPEQVDEAVDALIHELEVSVRELPTEEEVVRARNTLAGGHLVDMQTRMAWASTYARDEVQGLGYEESLRYLDEIDKVTPEMVREAAVKYLDTSRLVVATLRPETGDVPEMEEPV